MDDRRNGSNPPSRGARPPHRISRAHRQADCELVDNLAKEMAHAVSMSVPSCPPVSSDWAAAVQPGHCRHLKAAPPRLETTGKLPPGKPRWLLRRGASPVRSPGRDLCRTDVAPRGERVHTCSRPILGKV